MSLRERVSGWLTRPKMIIFCLVAVLYALAFWSSEQHAEKQAEIFLPAKRYQAQDGRAIRPFTIVQEHKGTFVLNEAEAGLDRVYRIRLSFDYHSTSKKYHHMNVLQGQEIDKLKFYLPRGRNIFEGAYHGVFVVSTDSESLIDLNPPTDETLTLNRYEFRIIRQASSTPQFGERWPLLLLIIFIAVFVYWPLHRYPRLSQWVLVALSVGLLGMVDLPFTLGVLAFLLVIYGARPLLIRDSAYRGFMLALFLLGGVGFLAIFKYSPESYFEFFYRFGFSGLGIALGASYFFFRLSHLIMDWFRGLHTDLSLDTYLAYMLFFPTIPAGPIETPDGFINKRLPGWSIELLVEAAWRIGCGIFKKVLIAGWLFHPILFQAETGLIDRVVADPGAATYAHVVLLLFGFLLYAYTDLSAYTDIAIGVALLFGRRIQENFNYPLFKRNIAEFWKSYHMSLSDWSRRNVYFPVVMLTRNTGVALVLSMMAMGLWHHVNLNWGLWALHHGLGLVWIYLLGEIAFRYRIQAPASKLFHGVWTPVATLLTVFFAAGGTALVFIADIETALQIYLRFFSFH